MELTEEQKEIIRENFEKIQDISALTRLAFGREDVDGRSKEGKLVAKFLADNKFTYKTKKRKRKDDLVFTEDQQKYITDRALEGASSYKIAQEIYGEDIKKLSKQQRTVFDWMEKNVDVPVKPQSPSEYQNYIPPQAISRIIKKINDSTGMKLEDGKLNRHVQHCCERLKIHLNNSRFIAIMNNYEKVKDRELFEQEFVRLTWDKPDLTADEINLYMNVAKEIINLELITGNLQKLNNMFEQANEQDEMTVRLAEIIKAKSAEYHQCESRIENLTKKLQGDRSERMKNKHKENASFLSIVQLFQEEEERRNMIKIAEMNKQIIAEEADKLEDMAAWKARIIGVAKEDVI